MFFTKSVASQLPKLSVLARFHSWKPSIGTLNFGSSPMELRVPLCE